MNSIRSSLGFFRSALLVFCHGSAVRLIKLGLRVANMHNEWEPVLDAALNDDLIPLLDRLRAGSPYFRSPRHADPPCSADLQQSYACHYCGGATAMAPCDADGTGTTGRAWPSCCLACAQEDRWQTVPVGESEIPPSTGSDSAVHLINQAYFRITARRGCPA